MTAAKNLGRDLNREFADTQTRKYAYDFDYRMHGYMLRAFDGKLPAGRALEMGCFEGEFTKRLAAIYPDLHDARRLQRTDRGGAQGRAGAA